ncbi:aminotransferase class V-fold PLP-dependent enzyme [Streptomyces sp. NPDC020917]|uniref:aminotransferase class V-fold PLP-dependent enzyme n=1 Tax=Streptomyces sp. NPDC020917 TaxID=3365102 RepID=UPI00378F198B
MNDQITPPVTAGMADAGRLAGHEAAYLREFREPTGYLDFARFGPVSAGVAATLERAVRAVHTQGLPALRALDAEADAAGRAAARLLHAAAHEVAFVGSTSHGLFAAAYALRGPGDVLVCRRDFPAALYPWLRAAERGGLAVRRLDGPPTADAVRARLHPGVRAVCVSAVDSVTGFRAPLGAIKEVIGPHRVLVVDAVQAVGVVPIEVEAADVLAGGGQKWLRAGWGAALLLVRDRVAGMLEPGLGGWSGVRDPLTGSDHPKQRLPGAAAHTFTNPDGPAVAALGTGISLALRFGVQQIFERATAALELLLEAARSQGCACDRGGPRPDMRSAIARIRKPGDPETLHRRLLDAGLTTTLRDGWIRLSPHASTGGEAALQLAAVLRDDRRTPG